MSLGKYMKSNVWIDFWTNVWVKCSWFTVYSKHINEKEKKRGKKQVILYFLVSLISTNHKVKALDVGCFRCF